jgi:hypothetical protein
MRRANAATPTTRSRVHVKHHPTTIRKASADSSHAGAIRGQSAGAIRGPAAQQLSSPVGKRQRQQRQQRQRQRRRTGWTSCVQEQCPGTVHPAPVLPRSTSFVLALARCTLTAVAALALTSTCLGTWPGGAVGPRGHLRRRVRRMASRWAGISDRIVIAASRSFFGGQGNMEIGPGPDGNIGIRPVRPPGVYSGRWTSFGPVWVRLGRRSSWPDEDIDGEMITPVKPSRTRKDGT